MRPGRRLAFAAALVVVAVVAGPLAPPVSRAADAATEIPSLHVSVPATVVAGTPFAVAVTAVTAGGSPDATYCATSCTLIITSSASAALDGTPPTPARGTTLTATFIEGSWKSDPALLTFYRSEQAIVIVTDADLLVGGTSPPIRVAAGAVDGRRSVVTAGARTAPADGSAVPLWVRVVDAYQNPRTDLSVTLATTRGTLSGGTDMPVTAAGTTAAATIAAVIDGTAVVSAMLSGPGTVEPLALRFVPTSLRSLAGTYYGVVTNGTTTKFDLEVTAMCAGTCAAPNAAGHPIDTTLTWSAVDMMTGAPVGTFDSATTRGWSGDPSHRTAYRVESAGRICVTASWTDPDGTTSRVAGLTGRLVTSTTGCRAAETIAGLGVYDVTSTSAAGATTLARALWDGAIMRVIGWWTK